MIQVCSMMFTDLLFFYFISIFMMTRLISVFLCMMAS